MASEIAALAQFGSAFLAPHWPQLARMGEGAAEEVSKQIGVQGWHLAVALWNALRKRQGRVQATLDEQALRAQLLQVLQEDPVLAAQLSAFARAQGAPVIDQRSGGNYVVGTSVQVGDMIAGDVRTPATAKRRRPR